MTPEDKELLLQDLCARLPYDVIMTNIELPQTHYPLTCGDLHDAMFDDDWDDVPYLRPISSMTEEEYNSIKPIIGDHSITFHAGGGFTLNKIKTFTFELIDWLNKNKFDYRGLIPKGCAIQITEENNPYK